MTPNELVEALRDIAGWEDLAGKTHSATLLVAADHIEATTIPGWSGEVRVQITPIVPVESWRTGAKQWEAVRCSPVLVSYIKDGYVRLEEYGGTFHLGTGVIVGSGLLRIPEEELAKLRALAEAHGGEWHATPKGA
ncbi:hypothetical protein ES703_120756 [subsurface metagenome]